jgi:protein involved in polysaccharide export with SLBB domain
MKVSKISPPRRQDAKKTLNCFFCKKSKFFLRVFAVNSKKLLCLFLAIFLLFAGPVSSLMAVETSKDTPKEKSKTEKTYPQLVIGPGDILFITVYGETGGGITAGGGSQLTTDYQVDSNGVITYPFLGEVHLAGLTPAEASEKIAKLLLKPRKVSVLVKESNTFWVSILGNVGKPGKYQIKGAPTLLSALAEAGGPLPGSDLGGTILIHDNFKAKINLGDLLQGEGDMKLQPYLYPGDTVMVPKSGWPDLGELAIVASILTSGVVVAVEINSLHR